MRERTTRVDLTRIRERLAGDGGRRDWRSLEEIAETGPFQEVLRREFPEQASEWSDPLARRSFLQLMAASLALAGLSSCAPRPADRILPYWRQPEDLLPGRPLFFATAATLGGYAAGVLVESHEGRPTKIEGNPDHPASLGATDAITQASILTLYDPDRSKTLVHLGDVRPYADFLGVVREALDGLRTRGGAGLRFLTGAITSPTLASQIEGILADLPEARWHVFEPVSRDNARAGAILAFGEPVETIYRLDRADVIVSLDADFLGTGPGHVRRVKDFSSRRRLLTPEDEMNRLYQFESTPSLTGAKADHRWSLRPSQVEALARALAAALGVETGEAGESDPGVPQETVGAIARDLRDHAGRGVVLAGEVQPPFVHAAAHAMNAALGNTGVAVVHTDPVEARSVDHASSMAALVDDMRAGRVEMLVILGGNPVFTAPADLGFAEALEKVGLRIHLGLYNDETAYRCHWHVPEAHELESWGDARAFDGTITILQPLIEPLYGGRTAHELLAAFTEKPSRTSREIVREHWASRLGETGFERAWERALHDGLIAGTALPPKGVALKAGWWKEARRVDRPASPPEAADRADDVHIEIVFRADPAVHDGRFANNGWLQETPRPLTLITWDNAALVAPALAERLGLASEDVVEISLQGRSVRAPVWVMPGHADGCVTIHLGCGRTRAGRVGDGVGFDAYAIRPSASPWIARGAEIRPTGERHALAVTQEHHSMEGRHLVRSADLDHWRADPDFARHLGHEPDREVTLHPAFEYGGHAWGMAIDLGACIGCGACLVACQSENNVPIVGKEQVRRGREMHWIRVDRYYEGGLDDPGTCHQPVMCMHCENAPCEPVCPVAATVHSSEGLNDMVYNRCVGTRYCSNNCPYKVRRFNFLQWSDYGTPSLALAYNPDVTVRTRGVMEKCTYCVQRINRARNEAERENRPIRDGEIVTACQQVCPAEAIVFGDVNDPASRVSRMKSGPRAYGLLADLNTNPRTSYLAAVRNPNPGVAKERA